MRARFPRSTTPLRFVPSVALVTLSACGGRYGASSGEDHVDDAGHAVGDAGNGTGDGANAPVYMCSTASHLAESAGTVSGRLDVTSFRAGFLSLATLIDGPDGNLWFTSEGGGNPDRMRLDRITPTGSFTEVRRAGSFDDTVSDWMLHGIVTGPDGNVWANELGDVDVVVTRTTPAGDVTAFPVEGATDLGGIAVGADGNVWFTTYGASERLGLVTRDGKVVQTTWNAPWKRDAIPNGPIASAAENLWFAETPGKIGRANVDGTVVEFTLPAPTDTVDSIVVDSDGNVWFRGAAVLEGGATSTNVVGRVTPAGCITEFRFELANRRMGTGLAVDRDGHLWFAAQEELVQFTPPGTVIEYALPLQQPMSTDSAGDPCLDGELDCLPPRADAVAVGPDGHIWFTDDSTPSHVIRISAIR